MSDFFYNLVQDLMVLLRADDQRFDPGPTVQLSLHSGASFTLEMSHDPYAVLICWDIGPMPQSTNRELWVKEALRWNGDIYGQEGVLSFQLDNDILTLHHYQELENLNAETLLHVLERMHTKVVVWMEALKQGYPPTHSDANQLSSSFKGPMMAFRP